MPTAMVELPDGKKFKRKEKQFRTLLPATGWGVMRLDGKNFSDFTKQYERPYDERFMSYMDFAAATLLETFSGSVLAYVQSDEISLLFKNTNPKSQWWFGGKVDKLLSVSAATVTAAFLMKASPDKGMPVFDARLHMVDSPEEWEEYVRWRRFDAQKNSVTMAASCYYSQKQLLSVSSKKRLQLLEGTEHERLPEGFYNGRVVYKETYTVAGHMVMQSASKHRQPKTLPAEVSRKRVVTTPATREFMETTFLELMYNTTD